MSTYGNKWIVVAIEYLTRYTKTGSAIKVAKFFIENMVLHHRAPKVLITDRATAFMADLTQAVFRYTQIQ